jgi:hypothetical protein
MTASPAQTHVTPSSAEDALIAGQALRDEARALYGPPVLAQVYEKAFLSGQDPDAAVLAEIAAEPEPEPELEP